MTTMPKVPVLKPGTAEARESQDDTSSTRGEGAAQTEELTNVEFDQIEHPPQYQPGEVSKTSASLGSAVHNQIEIGSLLDNRLRMREPLILEIEREEEFYIAKSKELNEFGYGMDPISAVQDMRNTLAELYWQLKENQDRLGSDLARTWERLSSLVYEV
jgi:hypothetical protein